LPHLEPWHVYPKPVPQRLFGETTSKEVAAGALELDDLEIALDVDEAALEGVDEAALKELEPLQVP
jgi:hypothetical protein